MKSLILVNSTQGDDVRLLHRQLLLLGFRIPASETRDAVFGPRTQAAVRKIQEKAGLKATGVVNRATARAIDEQLGSLPASVGAKKTARKTAASDQAGTAGESAPTFKITGTVTSPERSVVGVLRVEIVGKQAGPDVPLAETATDARGRYSVEFPASKVPAELAPPDLQARVFAGKTFLASSEIRYDATSPAVLDATVPAGSPGLPSEYESLLSALEEHYTGDLRDLEESDERQDITYLANKAGCEARTVAMAAAADELAAESGLHPAFYYALLRAGYPADPDSLYQADPETAGGTWKTAIDQGVIPSSLESKLAEARKTFQKLAAERLLDNRAVSGTSSLKEMVQLTLRDEKEQQKFAELYTRHRNNLPKFWSEVRKAFGAETAAQLQLDGQLGLLTLNNAPLMKALRSKVSSPEELVQGGFYRAEAWKSLTARSPIPEQIPGESDEERRANYAESMAAQVRASFPTAVVAERIRKNEIKMPSGLKNKVIDLLAARQGEPQSGTPSINRALSRSAASDSATPDPEALEQIKRLGRVYQIAPNDQAMIDLLNNNMDSAYKVIHYEEEEFIQFYAKNHPDNPNAEAEARSIHAKAKQVYNTALNMAVSYLIARNAPGLGMTPGASVIIPGASDILDYPTLENLFGSMDYCACEHCRSVLSPAAYLVDLLQFLDRPEEGDKNPQKVLLGRRPDLQHLPLTCENTNTSLPYIDLVIEVLEYFVTNNLSLAGYDGYDTGENVSSEELLANPQFVNEAAYKTLKAEIFPPPLPFHKRLETMRRYFEKHDLPLHEAMAALRKDDVLERPNAAGYGWRDILMERLKLSRDEHRLLTDKSLTVPQIYGLPTGADPLVELAKAKPFTRRVGITYEELVEILKTQFIRRLGPIVLTDTSGAADLFSFDALEFRRAKSDGTTVPVQKVHYVALLRFLRLWKKLGLSIDQTDRLIAALAPPALLQQGGSEAAMLDRLDKGFTALLPRIGVAFQVMERLKLAPERDLQDLLACWSPTVPGGASAAQSWLARKLRLSTAELLPLIRVTGLDPFAAPDPPNPPMIRFLDLVEALAAAALKPAQALYLLWNEDLSGKSAPDDRLITDLARVLRTGCAAIESELAMVDDPNGQIARARMALVYGVEATDFFFGLLENTLRLEVPYSQTKDSLEPKVLNAAKGRLAYDSFRKRLSYAGALDQAAANALKSVTGVSSGFKKAVDDLLAASKAATDPFFARYPELESLYSNYSGSTKPPEEKRTALLAAFLPKLKERRKRQQALAAASAGLGTDPGFTQALLADKAVLHAAADAAKPALDDLLALESAAAAGISFSGALRGYLEAPENGLYNLRIETQPEALAVQLSVAGTAVELERSGKVWSSKQPIDLMAGALHRIEVSEASPAAVLRWQTEGRGWQTVPARCFYSSTLIDQLRSTAIRLLKASSLAAALKMTAREAVHFATRAEYQIGGRGWLNSLTDSGRPGEATWAALRDVLIGLLTFARLKSELSPDDERLLSVLQKPDGVLPDGQSLLLTLTGWETASRDALLAHFGLTAANLSRVESFSRVHDACRAVKKLGIPAAALLAAVTNEPAADAARGLQAALRNRYDPSTWLTLVRPINDELRGLQRDALVAFILRKLAESPATRHIDTSNKLFEYFLMDVEMEPCMQTSRVRHALSSAQLFIERCLMNLETRVPPALINATHWEWMKRYRVWEANRKVFLWPENWLEPELRDDQSPFFKESMSELLQGDITDDAAAAALLNYLSKLDQIAKLEPCSIHHVESERGKGNEVTHVVGRTTGANRKYYYRRREAGSWTPWEQIKLDVEDYPAVVVWKNRLLLFWTKIVQKGPDYLIRPGGYSSVSLTSLGTYDIPQPPVKYEAMLCWSEYHGGKWQPAKMSDPERPTYSNNPYITHDRRYHKLQIGPDGDALRVMVGYNFHGYRLYNTYSPPVRHEELPQGWDAPPSTGMTRYLSLRWDDSGARVVRLNAELYKYTGPNGQTNLIGFYPLLQSSTPPRVTDSVDIWMAVHPHLQNPWTAPFFFEDSHHLFHVTIADKPATIASHSAFGASMQAVRASLAAAPMPAAAAAGKETQLESLHGIGYGGGDMGTASAVFNHRSQR